MIHGVNASIPCQVGRFYLVHTRIGKLHDASHPGLRDRALSLYQARYPSLSLPYSLSSTTPAI